MIQGSFKVSKRSSRVFVGRFKDVLRKFQGCFKKESSVFLEKFIKSFKGITFNEVLSGFQGCLKEVEWVFGEVLQGVSRMFQENFI